MSDIENQLRQRIEFLEAQLSVQTFLNRDSQGLYDSWERALRRYADDESGPTLARRVLGIREYWDAENKRKRFRRLRRIWRRIKWFFN